MNLRARASEAWGRVMALFSTRQHDRDLAEDLETHLELLTDEYVRRGMDRQAARRAARLQFGTMSSAMEAHRDARSARWIEAAVKDARYAVRMLRKQPGLACAVILTLGLGIGVPTSVVSLLDRFAFRTPVSRDPGTFFRLALERSGGRGVATLPLYLALRDEAQPIEDLAAWSTFRLTAPLGLDDPTRVDGLLVSCNLFQVFGVAAPVAGRLLTADDCASGAAVAVMSEGTWTRRFGRDPAIIGTSMIYGGLPITVVGVSAGPALQRQATDPDADEISDLWFPYSAKDSLKSVGAFHESPNWPWLELAGHRKVGVSLAAAEAEITALERQRNPKPSRETALRLTDGSRWAASTDDILGLYALALILPVVVLIMASVSVAALLLSRGAARRREVAVRLALGASRGALVRMLFVESLVVSGAAALLALVIVYNVPPFLVRFFDGELMFGSIDRLSPDWRVFMTLAVCGVMAGLLAGLAPALESLSPRLAESLFGRPRGGSRRGMSRTRRVLVAVQIASGMVLLVTAATFSRTGARVTTPGFETRGVLVAEIPDQQKRVSLSTLADDVAALGGLDVVAYTDALPVASRASAMRIRSSSLPQELRPQTTAISPGYFEVFGFRVLAGRGFEKADGAVEESPRPILRSRQFARRVFGDENVLGRTFDTDWPSKGSIVVVGIAEDRLTGWAMVSSALTDGSMVYQRMAPTSKSGYLVMRVRGETEPVAERVRALLRERTGMPMAVSTFNEKLAEAVTLVRQLQTMLIALGIVSLGLALIGVIGSVSFDANQRRKEFAIRLALGAGPGQVRQQVVRSGLRAVHVGLAVGLFGSWGLLKFVESARLLPLRSVAADPWPYAAVAVLLLAIALATLLVVAYPAGRRVPLVSLRVV